MGNSVVLTQKQFKVFEKAVTSWQKALGLLDWDLTIDFDLRKQDENDDNIEEAWCSFKHVSRAATIGLRKFQKYPFTDCMIKKAALHEIGHVFLADLDMMITVTDRYSDNEINKEVHKAIARLINLVFPND